MTLGIGQSDSSGVAGKLFSSLTGNSGNGQSQDPRGVEISIWAEQQGITDENQIAQLALYDGCDDSDPDGYFNDTEQKAVKQAMGLDEDSEQGNGLSGILKDIPIIGDMLG